MGQGLDDAVEADAFWGAADGDVLAGRFACPKAEAVIATANNTPHNLLSVLITQYLLLLPSHRCTNPCTDPQFRVTSAPQPSAEIWAKLAKTGQFPVVPFRAGFCHNWSCTPTGSQSLA